MYCGKSVLWVVIHSKRGRVDMAKVLTVCFFLSIVFFNFSQDIKIIWVSGTVKIKQNENAQWVNVQVGQKLKPGNFIFTGFKSNAIVQAANAKIEVKPLSQISVASLIEEKNNVNTDIQLNYGRIKATVEKSEDKKVFFKVRSANSTASVRGTIFTFANGEIYVEDGTVEITNAFENSALVQKGEMALIPPDIDFIKGPFDYISDYYNTDIRLIGLSDSESYGGINALNNAGSDSQTSFGSVVIKIRILK